MVNKYTKRKTNSEKNVYKIHLSLNGTLLPLMPKSTEVSPANIISIHSMVLLKLNVTHTYINIYSEFKIHVAGFFISEHKCIKVELLLNVVILYL